MSRIRIYRYGRKEFMPLRTDPGIELTPIIEPGKLFASDITCLCFKN